MTKEWSQIAPPRAIKSAGGPETDVEIQSMIETKHHKVQIRIFPASVSACT